MRPEKMAEIERRIEALEKRFDRFAAEVAADITDLILRTAEPAPAAAPVEPAAPAAEPALPPAPAAVEG